MNPDETVIDFEDATIDATVKDVEIAYLGSFGGEDRMMTASRDSLGNLYLVTWGIASDGTITKLDDETAGKVADISIADGGDHHALTAVRDHVSGKLEVIGWQVSNFGVISRRGSSPGEAIREVAIGSSMLVNPTTREQAVSVLRDDRNVIKVVSWQIGLEQ